MLTIATGCSEEPDTVDAIREAIAACEEQLGGAVPKAAIAFAAIDFNLRALVHELRRHFPGIELIGCTTDGEIATPQGFFEDGIALTLFASDTIDIAVGIGHESSVSTHDAAADAVAQARAKSDKEPALCIALPDGLGGDISEVVAGLRTELGENFPIVGGAAGDQLRFQRTEQFCNDTIATDSVAVMLLSGPLKHSAAVATGWVPMGNSHVVTRASGNTLYTIDNRPAIELYNEYLKSQSIFFPLAAYLPEYQEFFLSTPQSFDEETGAVNMLNTIPEGSEVRLASASRDEIVKAARTSVAKARENFKDGEPDAALVFSCAGRRAALGTRTSEEYQLVEEAMGRMIPTAGFYSYGEICSLVPGHKSQLHNCTFVTLLMGEAAG